MKGILNILAVLMFALGCGSAAALTLEDVSPHFSTNTQIIWRATTNGVPAKLWIYKKIPRVFSAATISNAVVLASFQKKGFPASTTNDVVLWADPSVGEPRPPSLAILPFAGQLSYTLGDRLPERQRDVVSPGSLVERGWNCLIRLNVDLKEFIKTNAASTGKNTVTFTRQIDGITFLDDSEGFWFQQFGSNATIGGFSLMYPKLEPQSLGPIASPQQIINCIRAFKTPALADEGEMHYAEFLRNFKNAKTLTITKMTAYYGDGVYGETPTNGELSKFVEPLVQLEATASFGNSNLVVKMYSPILSSEVVRLLGK